MPYNLVYSPTVASPQWHKKGFHLESGLYQVQTLMVLKMYVLTFCADTWDNQAQMTESNPAERLAGSLLQPAGSSGLQE